MHEYTVSDALWVPLVKNPAGRMLDIDKIAELWKGDWKEFAGKRGCYVFAFKAAKGYKPVYIGKATKTFKQECFADHKQNKIHKALTFQKKGYLYLYLIQGSKNKSVVDDLETFLIRLGAARNPNLQNDRKKPIALWSIKGVFNTTQGQPSRAAQELRKVLGLRNKAGQLGQ